MYIISSAEKEGRLDLQESTGRPKTVKQRVERKIIKTAYDSLQSNTRGLALQVEKDLWCFLFYQRMCTLFHKMQYRVCFLKMFSTLKGLICSILNNLHFPMVEGIAFYALK